MLNLINSVGRLVDSLIVIVIALAVLAFFWGLAKFIFNVGGDEKVVQEGKRIMIWGIIALFVMVSVWGIIRFLQGELNLNKFLQSPAPTPTTPTEPPVWI